MADLGDINNTLKGIVTNLGAIQQKPSETNLVVGSTTVSGSGAGFLTDNGGVLGETQINNLPTFVPLFTTQNFYVDPVAGNNGNDGLSPGTAWQTILWATLSVLNGYFAPNSTAQINLANGTYNISTSDGSGAYFGTPMNWSQINFVGNPGSPSSVVIDGSLTSNDAAFYISQNSAGVTVGVNGVQIQNFSGGAGRGFNCQSAAGTFQPQNIIFAGGIDLCFGIEGGFVEVEGPLTFSGTNGIGVYVNGTNTNVDFNGSDLTFGGGAAFSDLFINIDNSAEVALSVSSVTGTVTGGQFTIGYGGLLRAVFNGVDVNPSDIPGDANTGRIDGGWFNNIFGSTPIHVGSLPTGSPGGSRAMVDDATATTFNSIVAGSGGNTVPVFNDGLGNWRIG